MKWSTIGLAVLHIVTALTPLGAGLLLRDHPFFGCMALMLSGMFIAALISRALRVDEDVEMLMSALSVPLLDDDEDTLPNAPVTGVKHKTISDTPRIVTWHGKRGRG